MSPAEFLITAIAYVDLGALNLIVALAVAIWKAVLLPAPLRPAPLRFTLLDLADDRQSSNQRAS